MSWNAEWSRFGLMGALVALSLGVSTGCKPPEEDNEDDEILPVLTNHAIIAHATYADALAAAEVMNERVDSFLGGPTDGTMNQLKSQYIIAREPWTLAEGFRFYGGPVDGVYAQTGAWRMDPAFVDYTTMEANAGIINDADTYPNIDADTLEGLNRAENFRDVTLGYHVVELLLWGEDIYADSPGKRPVSDYIDGGNVDRRKKYLRVAAQQLVDDLSDLEATWAEDGDYRTEFIAQDKTTGVAKILKGLSTLTEVELAHHLIDAGMDWEPGAPRPPEELSPFNDRTPIDLERAVISMRNIYTGYYEPVDGEVIEGRGIDKLVHDKDPDLDGRVKEQIQEVLDRIALVPEVYETALNDTDESRDSIDDVRDQLRKLDELWREVGLLLEVEVEHGDDADEGDSGDETGGETGEDEGGTVFLPSSDMG